MRQSSKGTDGLPPLGMSKDDIDFIQKENQIWRCTQCSRLRRTSIQVESELEKSSPDISDVMKLLHEMRQENKDQTKKLELELGKSIELCHQTISELRKTVDSQSEALNSSTSRKQSKDTSKGRDGGCLPQTWRKSGERPRGIVVKFTRRTVKEEFLQKRRVKRNLNTSDIDFPSPASVIYINESLTPTRRRIFNEVRSIKKEKGFTFIWIRNGEILVRPSEGDKVSAVSNWNDVEKLRKLPAATGSPQAPGFLEVNKVT
ncbi:hypothetical protein J6590_090353 [Homalodisca vitripennis]|nr:hypothetical protein J6590_090353 [Homalodisca vitripennis]